MDVKTFYEKMYCTPNKAAVRLPFLYRKLRRFEVNRYELAYQFAPSGEFLLDIGCGNGEVLLRLKNKYKQLWGVDILEPKIVQTGDDIPQIHICVADVNEPLVFTSGSFDTITIISVLEHIFDPYSLIRECHRLLRQGGTLIVQVPNIAWLPYRLQLFFGKLPVTSTNEGWDGGHLHYFTRDSLKKLFRSEGFKVMKITTGGIFARFRRIWGSLLGADILIVGVKK